MTLKNLTGGEHVCSNLEENQQVPGQCGIVQEQDLVIIGPV